MTERDEILLQSYIVKIFMDVKGLTDKEVDDLCLNLDIAFEDIIKEDLEQEIKNESEFEKVRDKIRVEVK